MNGEGEGSGGGGFAATCLGVADPLCPGQPVCLAFRQRTASHVGASRRWPGGREEREDARIRRKTPVEDVPAIRFCFEQNGC